VNLITSTALFKLWKKKTKKKNKQEGMWERMTQHTAKEFMIRDPKTGALCGGGGRCQGVLHVWPLGCCVLPVPHRLQK
jgi:hypothetical protein